MVSNVNMVDYDRDESGKMKDDNRVILEAIIAALTEVMREILTEVIMEMIQACM